MIEMDYYELIGKSCAVLLLIYAVGMTYYFLKGELGGKYAPKDD